jgi:hypothetical protein
MQFDDSAKAKTTDEAIRKAETMAGIFRGIITEEVKQSICNLEPGEALRIRRSSIKFSMRIRRNKS